MITIFQYSDLERVDTPLLVEYFQDFLDQMITEYPQYCSGGSIEQLGAIYLLESQQDRQCLQNILPCDYEWCDHISDYIIACYNIDTDRSVLVAGIKKFFEECNS